MKNKILKYVLLTTTFSPWTISVNAMQDMGGYPQQQMYGQPQPVRPGNNPYGHQPSQNYNPAGYNQGGYNPGPYDQSGYNQGMPPMMGGQPMYGQQPQPYANVPPSRPLRPLPQNTPQANSQASLQGMPPANGQTQPYVSRPPLKPQPALPRDQSPIFILSIDGASVRGLGQLEILKKNKPPRRKQRGIELE